MIDDVDESYTTKRFGRIKNISVRNGDTSVESTESTGITEKGLLFNEAMFIHMD